MKKLLEKAAWQKDHCEDCINFYYSLVNFIEAKEEDKEAELLNCIDGLKWILNMQTPSHENHRKESVYIYNTLMNLNSRRS